MKITELFEDIGPKEQKTVQDFIEWVREKIHLKAPAPQIEFSNDTKTAQDQHHTGSYNHETGKLWVYAANRNLVDILRTVAHELVHVRQYELNQVNSSGPGSPVEVQADEVAGFLMKLWIAKHHDTIQ